MDIQALADKTFKLILSNHIVCVGHKQSEGVMIIKQALLEAQDDAAKGLVAVLKEFIDAVDHKEFITRIFHCYKNGKQILAAYKARPGEK